MNLSVRTLLMSAFEIDAESLEDSIKQQNINAFLQKPISLTICVFRGEYANKHVRNAKGKLVG